MTTTLHETLPARIARHAAEAPERIALRFTGGPGAPAGTRDYASLAARLETVGAAIAARFAPGERVLLLLPCGIDYVEAMLGCFRAGVIAVPVNLPGPSRLPRVLEKLTLVAADCTPAGVVTLRMIADASGASFDAFCRAHALAPLFLDQVAYGGRTDRAMPAPDDVAFLQYTSGSTGDPKGVMNTHRALSANFAAMGHVHPPTPDVVMANWMPLHHDMGLIGGVLYPLHAGGCTALMPAARFMQDPLAWLRLCSEHAATVMSAPNFALDLCVRKVPREAMRALDLSSVRRLMVGAEPIRPATLAAFHAHFAPAGLRADALCPSYGLAEATLLVTALLRGRALDPVRLEIQALQAGYARPVPADDPAGRDFAASGDHPCGFDIRIVDPETCRELPDGRVGEIWLAGPSVGPGYWNRVAESDAVFRAALAGDTGAAAGGYLRTGDLGLRSAGRLVVTGRRKDAIILQGRCHYPADIEHALDRFDARLLPQGGACFAVETEAGEAAVLLHEALRGDAADDARLLEAIRAHVAAEHGVLLHAVGLLRKGTLRRTTSGKVRRLEMRRAWLAGELALIAERRWGVAPPGMPASAARATEAEALRRAGPAERRLIILDRLNAILAPLIGPEAARLPEEAGFFDLGLDSAGAATAAAQIEATFGLELSPTIAFEAPTLARLAAHILERLGAQDEAATTRLPAEPSAPDAVAVIGMGCRFPGGALGDRSDPGAFLDLLLAGMPARRGELRWGGAREGHLLEAIERFDAAFFGISPREAASIDPQHRLVLETTWHALEDAGIPALSLRGQRVSIHLGLTAGEYGALPFAAGAGRELDAHYGTGNAPAAAAGRIAHVLGTEGEAVAIDTACSSSLAALHFACRSVLLDDVPLALAGGVQVLLSADVDAALRRAGMLAADGVCKTFDAQADGYARGEGCGMLVLCRLSRAQAMGARVHAVIAGTALRQEGARSGLTVPDPAARVALLREGLARAGWQPAEVDYVEAHGTGTRLGDPIEIRSLAEVFAGRRDAPLLIGTAKTVVGHLEAAAGVVGVIKTIAALGRGVVPPHRLARLNPAIDLSAIPARLPERAEPWPAVPRPRRAIVTSFGFTGTIGAALIEQAPARTASADAPAAPWLLLPVSARSEDSFTTLRAVWAQRLAEAQDLAVAALGRGAARMRSHLEWRGCAFGMDAAALRASLATLEAQRANGAPRICFLFTGQGAQHTGMARGLAASCPAFRAALAEADDAIAPLLGRSVVAAMDTADAATLRRTGLAQPVLFALGYALAALWRHFGVRPAVVAGHSIGEFAAAVAAGHLRLADAARIVVARGRLMDALPAGDMLALAAPEAEALALIAGLPEISVAAANTPDAVVVAGLTSSVATVEARAAARGIAARRLDVSHAFHSPMMAPVAGPLTDAARGLAPGREEAVFVSTLRGATVGASATADARYWAEHATAPVRFADAIGVVRRLNCDVLVEIGPRPVLLPLARRAWGVEAKPPLALASLDPPRQDPAVFGAALAALHSAGQPLDWEAVQPGSLPAPEALPLYPFDRRAHWHALTARAAPAPRRTATTEGVLTLGWETLPARLAPPPGRLVIVPDHGGVAGRILPELRSRSVSVIAVDGRDRRGLDAALAQGGRVVFLRGLDLGSKPEHEVIDELIALAAHLDRAHRGVGLLVTMRGASGAGGVAPRPGASLAWGATWALMSECAGLGIAIADLDPAEELDAPMLDRALGAPAPVVALRGDALLRPRLMPLAPPRPRAGAAIRADATYLVVGGFGGIGRAIARWLADAGARHIVLAGRRAPDAAGRALLDDLQGRGAEARAVVCDIADRASVDAMLHDLADGPALRGVFHCAGLGLFAPLGETTVQDYRRMAVAKVEGSLVLDAATRHLPLDHFVLATSIAGVWGSRQQVGYAAVNAFQDALAAARRAEGLPALALAWGPWAGEGMAAADAAREALASAGISAASPEWHLARLEALLGADVRPPLVVADVAWPRLAALHEAVTGSGLMAGLSEHATPASTAAAAPETPRAIIAAVLRVDPASIGAEDNLVALGMDSILAMEIAQRIEAQFGAALPLRQLFATPTLAAIEAVAGAREAPARPAGPYRLTHDRDARHEAFPLTPLQHAYWVGRNPGMPLGNVACHAYLEFDLDGLDIAVVEEAWNLLVQRHDMLRCVFAADATQRVLDRVPRYRIALHDASAATEAEEAAHLDAWRAEMSHAVYPTDAWPLFALRATKRRAGGLRLHVSLDLLIADATAAQLLLAEFEALLRHGADAAAAGLAVPGITFRDYVMARQDAASGWADEHARGRRFWEERAHALPAPPALPLAQRPEAIAAPRFTRRRSGLDAAAWAQAKARIAAHGLTPASFLLALYAEVIARWSANQDFTLSLTLFDRRPWHRDVGALVGDFTAVAPLPVSLGTARGFAENAATIHATMLDVLEHRAFDATEVLRLVNRTRPEDERIMLPVVFTSQFGVAGARPGLLAHQGFAITQTPQVMLDHQVMEVGGALACNWDAVEALFAPDVLDAMVAAHQDLLDRLAGGDAAWDAPLGDLLPEAQRAVRAQVNATDAPLPDRLLHELFFDRAAQQPEATALIAADGSSLTYGALSRRAAALAARITAAAAGDLAGARIAVLMDKSPSQALAVLAILALGCVYVPLDPQQPEARLETILRGSSIRMALHEPGLPTGLATLLERLGVAGLAASWQEDAAPEAATLPPRRVGPRDPAYLLYTSGSTGTPKGVLLDHLGPVNTVLDINARFGITAQDRLFALSALGFDLSVYDLFGAFAAGAAVVFPAARLRRDPAHWAALIEQAGITVWNSVPALFDMLLSEATPAALARLRVVMLSGDWVPLTLPGRFREKGGAARLIALGGATEASIWSNWFEVHEVAPEWTSVPYGYPLTSQRYHVLDAALRHRPDWVEGDLHIAGIGLAIGYEGDAEKTAASFYPHPATQERLYRTGDLARYWPDGTLEFLGRRDMQVKIGGHRIELGEIEAAIAAHPAVAQAVVDAVTDPGDEVTSRRRRLLAWAVLRPEGDDPDYPVRSCETLPEPIAQARWRAARDAAQARIDAEPPRHGSAELEALLRDTARQMVRDTLVALGIAGAAGATIDAGTVGERLGIVPPLRPVLADWLDLLAEAGDLRRAGRMLIAPDGLCHLSWDQLAAAAARLGFDPAPLARLRDDASRRAAVLRGEVEPLSLFFGTGDAALSPEALSRGSPGGAAMVAALAAALAALVEARGRAQPLRILQLEARLGLTTLDILRALPAEGWRLTVADGSAALLVEARRRLADAGFGGHPAIDFAAFDPAVPRTAQGIAPGEWDAVVIFNALHRTPDIPAQLARLAALPGPGGILLAPEITADSDLQRVTVALLGDGPASTTDFRQALRRWQVDAPRWCTALREAGFAEATALASAAAADDFVLLAARLPAKLERQDARPLRAFAAARLPAYMVPQAVMLLPALPLNATGKVDRRRLPMPAARRKAAGQALAGLTGTAARIAALWESVLGTTPEDPAQTFFDLGGDSLSAVRVIEALRQQTGVAMQVRDLFATPALGAFAALVEARLDSAVPVASDQPALIPAPADRHAPFPLTDVQEAYWIGRREGFALGGVSAHLYAEIAVTDLGFEAVERGWRALIARHPMLRAVIGEDGRQRVLPSVPDLPIPLVAAADATEEARMLADIRAEMSHRLRPADRWPLFEVRALRRPDGTLLLCVSLENMLFDGRSMGMLLVEWGVLARAADPEGALPPIGCDFRDHVLAARRAEAQPRWRAALDYWLSRIETLPAAPALPVLPLPAGAPRFVRRAAVLPAAAWASLREGARRRGLTANALLLAVQAETLRGFAAAPDFTLNLTLFQRPPSHPDIDLVVGDFTSLILLECRRGAARDLAAVARQTQAQIAADLAQAEVAAVRVLREAARRTGRIRGVICPYVFTSALGAAGIGAAAPIGRIVYGITQTPQVLLDHQVREEDGALHWNWDAVEAAFPPGLLDAAFAAQVRLLEHLAAGDAAWETPLPALRAAVGLREPGDAPARPLLPPAAAAPVGTADMAVPADLEARVIAALAAEIGAPPPRAMNVFEAGATSLALIRACQALRQDLGVPLEVVDLFEHTTPAALARHIAALRAGPAAAPRAAPPPAARSASGRAARRVAARRAAQAR